MNGVQAKVDKKIDAMEGGSVFAITDLFSCGNYEAVRKALVRIETKGAIKRLLPGIYTKGVKGETISYENIAYAIARKCSWTIAPTGDRCINIIGLRDFPYERYSYISTGAYRSYNILNQNLTFHHTSGKDLTSLSYKSAVVVQALKAIGMNNITVSDREKIRDYLTYQDRVMIKKECTKCTKWIHDTILSIVDEK